MNKSQTQTKTSNFSLLDNIAAPSPRYLMRIALLEDLIKLLPATTRSFLEIGPGMGDVSNYLINYYKEIHGDITDISENSIDIVRQRLNNCSDVTLSVSDFTQLPGSGLYDLVVACEVFEHLKNDDDAFNAVHRLLAKDGYFLFSVPAFMNKWGPADQYGGHIRRYEKSPLQQQFHDHGFRIIHFWTYGFPVTNIINPVSRLYYHLAQKKSPLTQQHATKRSGTERTLAQKLRFLPFVTLMKPFFKIQNLVKELNVGDGYIVLARKQ